MKVDKITPQIAALYLGQKWEVSKQPIFWDSDDLSTIPATITGTVLSYLGLYSAFEIAPHLRRLDSITEEEAREVYEIVVGVKWIDKDRNGAEFSCLDFFWDACFEVELSGKKEMAGTPIAWLYLLSKGFDLFGLIDSGLAKEMSR